MCAALRFLHRQSGCLSDTHVRRVRPEQEAQASPQPRGGRSLQAAWAHVRLSPRPTGARCCGVWRNTVRLQCCGALEEHCGPQVPGAAGSGGTLWPTGARCCGLWRNTVAHRCPVLRGLEELCAVPRQSPWSQMWRLLSGLPVAGSSPSALEARLSAERSAEERPASSRPPPGLLLASSWPVANWLQTLPP